MMERLRSLRQSMMEYKSEKNITPLIKKLKKQSRSNDSLEKSHFDKYLI